MCWSGEASTALAALGLFCTGHAIAKRKSPLLWAPLGYFSLMEALQAYTYGVINQCGLPQNEMATILGYLHICFQPFFINFISLYFINKRVAKKIAPVVYAICFACAILMIIKLYPFSWAPKCDPLTRPMCGLDICSFSGNWHIAWRMPINDLMHPFSFYLLAGFILPVLYGSWRFTAFHFVTGPLLAWLTTNNIHEWPAIWCLFSLDLLLVATNTRMHNLMFVRRWPGWDKLRKPRLPVHTVA